MTRPIEDALVDIRTNEQLMESALESHIEKMNELVNDEHFAWAGKEMADRIDFAEKLIGFGEQIKFLTDAGKVAGAKKIAKAQEEAESMEDK